MPGIHFPVDAKAKRTGLHLIGGCDLNGGETGPEPSPSRALPLIEAGTVRHPLDPVHLHRAAERLGDMVAADQLSEVDAAETIVAWTNKTNGVDRSGLQTRLNWTMRDGAKEQRHQREVVATAIRWAVRDLLLRNASQAEIEESANKANGDVLTWEEIAPILADEWDKIHRSKLRRGRR